MILSSVSVSRCIGWLIACLLPATGSVHALTPGDRVGNFKLLDHAGEAFELHYHTDQKAIAIMVQGNGCPLVRGAMQAYLKLQDQFDGQGVLFVAINSNQQDRRKTVAREVQDFEYDVPVLMDETQLIGSSLGLDRTSEVLLVRTSDWTLQYRGAVDDRQTYERQRAKAETHYLSVAITAVLRGETPEVASTESPGCIINFDRAEKPATEISYSEDIAPLLADKCAGCHRPGGIGPWAMDSYEMVHGFAPMIREVVRTKRMPPWHADPHVGQFANDRSMSIEETRTLVRWIEAGAHRGEGDDPLVSIVGKAPTWQLGEPDVVIDVPAYDVPPTGVVDYQYLKARNSLAEDVWVRAAELVPGDRSAVHHVITRVVPPSGGEATGFGSRALAASGGFGGYVPGAMATIMPENTGVLLPAGSVFNFQIHYTPYGRATTDKSRLGLYFHKEPPLHKMSGTVMINLRINIPANTPNHTETAQHTFKRDSLLYAMLPHAHYRGRSARFDAVYPDGSTEVLLSVPNYDFNWQTQYKLVEPKFIPEGTKVIFSMTWDNTALNPANPDPSRNVRWGRQSWDEMLFGTMTFRHVREEERASLAAGWSSEPKVSSATSLAAPVGGHQH